MERVVLGLSENWSKNQALLDFLITNSSHVKKGNLKLHNFGTLIGACCNIQLALVLSTIAGQNWGLFLTLEIRSFK